MDVDKFDNIINKLKNIQNKINSPVDSNSQINKSTININYHKNITSSKNIVSQENIISQIKIDNKQKKIVDKKIINEDIILENIHFSKKDEETDDIIKILSETKENELSETESEIHEKMNKLIGEEEKVDIKINENMDKLINETMQTNDEEEFLLKNKIENLLNQTTNIPTNEIIVEETKIEPQEEIKTESQEKEKKVFLYDRNVINNMLKKHYFNKMNGLKLNPMAFSRKNNNESNT